MTKPTAAAARKVCRLAAEGKLGELRDALDRHPSLAHAAEPILAASQAGCSGAVDLLLSRGANANAFAADGSGYLPLHRAVESGSPEVVRALLEQGADVERRGMPWQITPLVMAAFTPARALVSMMLPYIDRWDLFTAAALGEVRQVKAILRRDPTAGTEVDTNGMTALHCVAASRLGMADDVKRRELVGVAELLIAAHADVYARFRPCDGPAHTPASLAGGCPGVIDVLRSLGAAPDQDDESPVHAFAAAR